MAFERHTVALGIVGSVALIAFGGVSGMAIDRMRYDAHRAAVMRPYEDALQQRRQQLMSVELQNAGRHPAFERAWRRTLARIDESVRLGDTAAAASAWRDAYGDAVRSGHWQQLAEVGDAALQIGDAPEFAPGAQAAARKSYLSALHRARAERSVDGVLRIARSFAALGDQAVADHCLEIARGMEQSGTGQRGM
jgi:hypothetical protein